MSEPFTVSAPAGQEDAPARAGDEAWTRGLVVRQLELLGRLAEAGLNIALAIERQALAAEAAWAASPGALADVAPAPPEPAPSEPAPEPAPALASVAPAAFGPLVRGDVALAYGRVSRAVRLTVALQARLIEALQALDEGAARRRIRERADAQRAREANEAARKARVERIVERLTRAEVRDEADGDRLADEAYERLEHDDIYGDLGDRPVREIVAMICKDLGLAPDWSRLAEEAWAREERDMTAVAAAAAAPATIVWRDPPPTDGEGAACGAAPPLAELRGASP